VGQLQNLRVDFSEVSLANPLASGDRESVPSPEQVKESERFVAQRDAQMAAMLVVKELHLASNAENAVNCQSHAHTLFSLLTSAEALQHLSPTLYSNRCDHATTPRPSFSDSTGPQCYPLRRELWERERNRPAQQSKLPRRRRWQDTFDRRITRSMRWFILRQ
jgi:hypothetical protein